MQLSIPKLLPDLCALNLSLTPVCFEKDQVNDMYQKKALHYCGLGKFIVAKSDSEQQIMVAENG
jgi:hypothetical protein